MLLLPGAFLVLTPCWLPFMGSACGSQKPKPGVFLIRVPPYLFLEFISWLDWPASSGDLPIAVSHNLPSTEVIGLYHHTAFYASVYRSILYNLSVSVYL